MKSIKTTLVAVLIVILSVACKQSEKKSGEVEDHSKDITELTYQDVTELVFSDEGERMEWHGEQLPNNAIEYLSIGQKGKCGENDCGDALFLFNGHAEKSITAIVKGAYDIDGDIGYIARKYVVPAGKQLSMGCSHLCYRGKSYKFDREIVSSVYDTAVVQ